MLHMSLPAGQSGAKYVYIDGNLPFMDRALTGALYTLYDTLQQCGTFGTLIAVWSVQEV